MAAWAKSFGKKITGVYITHGHSDHWLGLARLLLHFPAAKGCTCGIFTTLGSTGGTVEDLVGAMLELHGERDQRHTLWISARAEVARQA